MLARSEATGGREDRDDAKVEAGDDARRLVPLYSHRLQTALH